MKNIHHMSYDFFRKFLFSRRAGALVKTIAWLCVFGIGVGVGALILILSVMNGFNASMKARRFSAEPHLVLYFDKMPLESVRTHPAVEWLKQQSGYKYDVTESQDVILRNDEGFVQGGIAQGISKENLLFLLNEIRSRQRKQLLDETYTPKPGEVIVGAGLADIMGLFESDSLVVIPPESLLAAKDALPPIEKVSVKGFLQTDLEEIDTRKLFYVLGESLTRLRSSASLERTVEVRIPDPNNYEPVKAFLQSEFKIKVDSWKDRNSNLFYSLKLEKIVVGILLGLSTLIASFSLVTVMALLVTQKKKDIGLLMALGFDPQSLQKTFLGIGIMLSGIGIFGGLFWGVVVTLWLGKFSDGFLPKVYEETNVPTAIDPTQVFIVMGFAIVFAILTTWISVRKISELEPVEALRGL